MSSQFRVRGFKGQHRQRWHVVKADGTKVYDTHDRKHAEQEAERRNASLGLSRAENGHTQR